MDGHPWWILLDWTVKAGAWAAAVAGQRRVARDPYAAAARALAQLPAGGEAGGTAPGGVTWYVRVPAPRQDIPGDGH